MKKVLKTVVILTLALSLSSLFTGCAGCGNDKTQNNTNDMVESRPATDKNEGTVGENKNPNTVSDSNLNGGNSTANDINGSTNEVLDHNGTVDANGNRVDENGNLLDDAGNIINDAGNAVGNAVDNVGDAVNDVVDGVGNGVRNLTR